MKSSTMNRHCHYIKKIESLREELHKSGLENGFTHTSTLSVSKKLDVLVNEYAKLQFGKSVNKH